MLGFLGAIYVYRIVFVYVPTGFSLGQRYKDKKTITCPSHSSNHLSSFNTTFSYHQGQA